MKRLILALSAAAAVALPASAQTVLTVSTWVPANHALTLAQKDWCDLLEKNTSRKMRCNILPRAVSAPAGTYDAIKNGVADISFTVHGYTPGRFVYSQMAEFPFLGNNAEPISAAYSKIAAKYPQFAQEHQDVHLLALFTHGPGFALNTKRPVTKLEELQGLKWRVGGGIAVALSNALGMNGTFKAAPETYELLSAGVLDGALFPADTIEGFKLQDLIKHATTFEGGLYNTSFMFIMNKARYEKLSAEEKSAVDAISGEVAARIYGRQWERADRTGHALLQSKGAQTVKADAQFTADVKARVAPLEAKWVQDAAAKGLPDPAKVLAEFRAEIAKQSSTPTTK